MCWFVDWVTLLSARCKYKKKRQVRQFKSVIMELLSYNKCRNLEYVSFEIIYSYS